MKCLFSLICSSHTIFLTFPLFRIFLPSLLRIIPSPKLCSPLAFNPKSPFFWFLFVFPFPGSFLFSFSLFLPDAYFPINLNPAPFAPPH